MKMAPMESQAKMNSALAHISVHEYMEQPAINKMLKNVLKGVRFFGENGPMTRSLDHEKQL